MASKAFRDKLETLIEEHLIPFSGSKQDELLDPERPLSRASECGPPAAGG